MSTAPGTGRTKDSKSLEVFPHGDAERNLAKIPQVSTREVGFRMVRNLKQRSLSVGFAFLFELRPIGPRRSKTQTR